MVHFYDKSLPLELLTDASRLHGFGYALIQKEKEIGQICLIQCGSRSLSPAESRYSATELEFLGVKWAIIECRHDVFGVPEPFKVITDNRALVGLMAKGLHEIEKSRLLRFRETLSPYRFTIPWAPGKTHQIADAFSRHPVFSLKKQKTP